MPPVERGRMPSRACHEGERLSPARPPDQDPTACPRARPRGFTLLVVAAKRHSRPGPTKTVGPDRGFPHRPAAGPREAATSCPQAATRSHRAALDRITSASLAAPGRGRGARRSHRRHRCTIDALRRPQRPCTGFRRSGVLRPAAVRVRPACGTESRNCVILPISKGVKHFHVWVRSGRVFHMRPRLHESRHTATSVARRLSAERC